MRYIVHEMIVIDIGHWRANGLLLNTYRDGHEQDAHNNPLSLRRESLSIDGILQETCMRSTAISVT